MVPWLPWLLMVPSLGYIMLDLHNIATAWRVCPSRVCIYPSMEARLMTAAQRDNILLPEETTFGISTIKTSYKEQVHLGI